MHKFYRGQTVEYYPPRGISAPRGAYLVTAKLQEQEGQLEYRIRSAFEEHERMARESELEALGDTDRPEIARPPTTMRLLIKAMIAATVCLAATAANAQSTSTRFGCDGQLI
jgi:hypothetical protein